MIQTTLTVEVYCDADLKRLRLTEAPLCRGTTGRHSTQAEALDAAKRDGFKAHKDGKHHLCKACAELNPEAVAKP